MWNRLYNFFNTSHILKWQCKHILYYDSSDLHLISNTLIRRVIKNSQSVKSNQNHDFEIVDLGSSGFSLIEPKFWLRPRYIFKLHKKSHMILHLHGRVLSRENSNLYILNILGNKNDVWRPQTTLNERVRALSPICKWSLDKFTCKWAMPMCWRSIMAH